FSFSNIRDDLIGKELHAAPSLFVGKRADLAACQYITGPELLLKMSQLLLHGVRASNDREHAVLDLLPGIHVSQELILIFQNPDLRYDRCVTGRREVDAFEQLFGKIPQAGLEIPTGLVVGLSNIDRDGASHLLGRGSIAFAVASLSELFEYPLEDFDMEVRDTHIRVALLRHKLHRLEGPNAWNPDSRMGLLNWTGPRLDVDQLVVV